MHFKEENGEGEVDRRYFLSGSVDAPATVADGRVTFVGTKSGYGKVVEISHGNGMLTRYAHMSAWKAEMGKGLTPVKLSG